MLLPRRQVECQNWQLVKIQLQNNNFARASRSFCITFTARLRRELTNFTFERQREHERNNVNNVNGEHAAFAMTSANGYDVLVFSDKDDKS